MRLEVKGKNVEVTPALLRYTQAKLAKLQKQLASSQTSGSTTPTG